MKQFSTNRRRREAGAALITAMLVSVATAMLLGAAMTVSLTSTKLGWKQSDAQAAMELADAGVNSELQFVAQNIGASAVTGKSSQPTAISGMTFLLNGVSTQLKGRSGTVPGYTGGTYYVYSSNDSAGSTAWDGATSPFYITCSAVVGNVWHTVQVQSTTASLFNVYGIFALGSYPSSPTSITLSPSANVNLTGSAGGNGTCSKGSGSSFHAPNAINANCGNHTGGGQFDSSWVNSGGQVCNVQSPMVYPRTVDCLKNAFSMASGTSDSSAWSYCAGSTFPQGTVWQYHDSSGDVTLAPYNCIPYAKCPTNLMNSCWNGVHQKPYNSNLQGGANKKIQTLIFEPGDYYFTKCQLDYDNTKEMIIDPCALASGGTPGPVRFWVYDPNYTWDGNPADYINQPIKNTCAAGSTPDPGMFRIYYGKDACSLTFTRPPSIQDASGNTYSGDFVYYCGVYASTKPVNDSTWYTYGATVGFCGTSSSSTGCATLSGSMLCDKLNFQGTCNATYTKSQNTTKDPCSGGSVVNWRCSG